MTESECKQEQIADKLSQFFDSLDKATNVSHTSNCSVSTLIQLVTLAIRPDRQINLAIKKAVIDLVVNNQSSEKFKEVLVADAKLIEQMVELHRVLQGELGEMLKHSSETNGLPKNTAIRSLKKKN